MPGQSTKSRPAHGLRAECFSGFASASPASAAAATSSWLARCVDMTDSPKPIVLLLGEVLHATKEWDELAGIAELRVSFVRLTQP